MKFVQAIRRFVSNAWLVAAPLVVLFLLVVVVPIFVGVVHQIIKRLFGPETADTLLMDAVMWTAMLVFVLTPIGFAIYATVRFARWLVCKKE